MRKQVSIVVAVLLVGPLFVGCTGPRHSKAAGPQPTAQDNRIWDGRYPDYPAEALRNHWEGTVVVRVVVGPDCRAREVALAQTSGHDVLDEAVLQAANQWTFRSDRIGTNDVTIDFRL